MLHKASNSKGEMPFYFPRSSIKFQGHTVQNISDFDQNLCVSGIEAGRSFQIPQIFLVFSLKFPNDLLNTGMWEMVGIVCEFMIWLLLVCNLNCSCYGKNVEALVSIFRNLHLREILARDCFTYTASTITNSVQNIFTHLRYCDK